jgi:uncharacterized protein (TIGR00369 family)
MTDLLDDLGPHNVTLTQWIECAPFEKLLGIELVHVESGSSVLTMPFQASFANGGSMLHGGALVALADTAAVMAIKSVIPSGTHFGTIHMSVDFHHPVLQGLVTAKCSVAQVEERIWEATVALSDHTLREVMTMHATFKISHRRLAIGAKDQFPA